MESDAAFNLRILIIICSFHMLLQIPFLFLVPWLDLNKGFSPVPVPKHVSSCSYFTEEFWPGVSWEMFSTQNYFLGPPTYVAQGAWKLEDLSWGRYHFLVTLACLAISSKKKCL